METSGFDILAGALYTFDVKAKFFKTVCEHSDL